MTDGPDKILSRLPAPLSFTGAERLSYVCECISKTSGLLTTPLLAEMLHSSSRPIVSRLGGRLESAGVLQRVRRNGTREIVLATTASFGRSHLAAPGTRFLRKGAQVWEPNVEFIHDQLALRVLFSLAPPSHFLTEAELDRRGVPFVRPPDGVLALRLGDREVIVALEVETSRKTGRQGGWAALAQSILDICIDKGLSRANTPIGRIQGTLVASTMPFGRAIANRMSQLWMELGEGAPPVYFLFREIRSKEGHEVRERKEIEVSSKFGPLLIWRQGRDAPEPMRPGPAARPDHAAKMQIREPTREELEEALLRQFGRSSR